MHASNIHHQHFHHQIMIKLSLSLSSPRHLGQCNNLGSSFTIQIYFQSFSIRMKGYPLVLDFCGNRWDDKSILRLVTTLSIQNDYNLWMKYQFNTWAFFSCWKYFYLCESFVSTVVKTNSWLWRWQLVIIPSDKALWGNWVAGLVWNITNIYQ